MKTKFFRYRNCWHFFSSMGYTYEDLSRYFQLPVETIRGLAEFGWVPSERISKDIQTLIFDLMMQRYG